METIGGKKMALPDQEIINNIISLLEKIKFGSLTIVIHEGKVTQLEVNEKHRFQK
jgi:hypothetical protein